MPGQDRDRAVGVKALDLAALRERHCGEPLEDLIAVLCGQPVTVDLLRVVRVEVLCDRRQ